MIKNANDWGFTGFEIILKSRNQNLVKPFVGIGIGLFRLSPISQYLKRLERYGFQVAHLGSPQKVSH